MCSELEDGHFPGSAQRIKRKDLSKLGSLRPSDCSSPMTVTHPSSYHLEGPWGASGTFPSTGDSPGLERRGSESPGLQFLVQSSLLERAGSGPCTGGRQAGRGATQVRSVTPQAHCHRSAIATAAREPAAQRGPGALCPWGGSELAVGGLLNPPRTTLWEGEDGQADTAPPGGRQRKSS